MTSIIRTALLPSVFACSIPWLLAALVALPVLAAAQSEEVTEVELVVGSTTSISVGRAADVDVVIGDKRVISVTPLVEQGSVAITGSSAGLSSLTLWVDRRRTLYRVRVHGTPPARLVADIGQLLIGVEGVEVRRVGDRVYVDGVVSREVDRLRVERVAELYRQEVVSLVRFDPSGREAPMFALEFQVIELTEAGESQLGVRWPTQVHVTGHGTLNIGERLGKTRTSGELERAGEGRLLSVVANTSSLMVGLDLMVREGLADVRTISTIVTEAGKQADYSVGGEFFVRPRGLNGGSIERVSHGTLLKVEPRIDDRRRVQLQIDASVSSLDFSQPVDGLPTLITNAIQTAVNLREGETAILSGLDARSRSTSEEGLWPFAQIPIIGYLFKSRLAGQSSRRTLVFVTPRLYRPGDDWHQKTINPLQSRWEDDGDGDF